MDSDLPNIQYKKIKKMKTIRIWHVLALYAVGLLFLASSSSVEIESAVIPPSTAVSRSLDHTMISKKIDTVVIKGMVFKPEKLLVHKGDIVVWVNKDIVAHNVTDFPENKWTSGTLNRGSSWKKTIDETFDYYCSIHPTMKGKIVVEP